MAMHRLLAGVVSLALIPFAAAGTALDDYVYTPDPAYGYTLLNTIPNAGYTEYVLEMTSQTWLSASEVDVPLWTHHLVLTVPDTPATSMAFLHITGGSSSSGVPSGNDSSLRTIALETSSVSAMLRQVPNQPLRFLDDPEAADRAEDHQIAYAWDQFLLTGDTQWLSRFPMTKAAVRAMDTITAFLAEPAQGTLDVSQFVVNGYSKRGWTTWTTAAVDSRVVALAPFVIDLLNIEESFLHHYAALGFWADAVGDYTQRGTMDWFGTRPFQDMLDLVDPYSYLDRYVSKPKYVYSSAGDEFFLPDSSQFYWDDLPGVKHLRYLPNTGHGLDGRAWEDVSAWYQAIIDGTAIPTFTWAKQPDGSIIADTTGTTPSQVLLWQATNSVRDFNHSLYGNLYSSSALAASGPNEYTASVSAPPSGFTAFFIEITYPSGGPHAYRFTTEVSIVPDTYVAQWDHDTDDDGDLDSIDTDDDNDGVLDGADPRPRDTDDDALPNFIDEDDDDDGFSDVDELAAGSDPLDPADYPGASSTEVPVGSAAGLAILAAAALAAAYMTLRRRHLKSSAPLA